MSARVLLFVILPLLSKAQDLDPFEDTVQTEVANNQFMGAILAARADQILLNKAYGSANLELSVPNTPKTKFRIASITKQFTAAAILLLEERGKLHLEDRINAHIPDPPKAWDKITILELLNHTSGLPNFTNLPEYSKLKLAPIAPVKLIALIRDKPLDFEPGTRASYSNSGYALLGYLIEQITGEPYQHFIQQTFLTPLHMADSGYDSIPSIIPNRASGYIAGPDGWENAPFIDTSILYAAAGMYSTTEDLLKWQRALYSGKVISQDSLKKMLTPYQSNFGLGVLSETIGGHRRISHGGGVEGFSSYLIYYPEDQITVAVLGNGMGNAAEALAIQLGTTLIRGDKPGPNSKHKEIELPPETLSKYVGTYEIAPKVNVYIRLDNGHLTEETTGQRRVKLYPESETHFFAKQNDTQVDFTPDHITVHQNAKDREATRTSNTVIERTEINVPPESLTEYAGKYQLPGLTLTITREGSVLTGHIPGQPAFALRPESKDRFFLNIVDAQIDFQRDQSNTITGLILHQGPRDEPGPRLPAR